MQTKEISYGGKRIVYRMAGAGPLVVLLHGFGEDGSIWKNQFSIFAAARLLVPDLPGSGGSEAIEDMSMEGLADAVKAIIDAEATDNDCATTRSRAEVILIGHSMGGYIALAFAEKYPECLRALGLFHSTAFADSEEKKEARRKGIRFMQEHGAAEFLKTAAPALYAPQTKEKYPEQIDEHLQAARNFSAGSLVSYYEAMIQRPDRTTVLQNSKVPVLFVMGKHDGAISLRDGLQQCSLPQIAYIHILEASGHMGMIEETAMSNQSLSQFVNDIEMTP